MSRIARISLVGLLVALVAGTFPACQSIGLGKDDFRIKDGKLFRGNSKFTLQAFEAPGMGASGGELAGIVPPMVRTGEVGGNAVCFDLTGYNEDYSQVDPAAVQTVETIAHRAKNSRMGVIVRVIGENVPPELHEKAVRTAAKALKRQGMVVYLFDGPHAAELAREFKDRAPLRVVIAPANGDLTFTDEEPAEYPGHLVVLDDVIPGYDIDGQHFILANEDARYEALDQKLMRPIEKDPPQLDPAILSEEEQAAGFVPLFNGEDLTGWWFKDPEVESFHVNDCGAIEWREKGAGAINSARRYSDFVLRCEWKILPGGNSGIWMRAPRGSRESKLGVEFQLRGDSGTEEPDESNTGSVYDVLPPLAMPAHREGEWNTLEVRFEGPHYKAWINGVVVQDVNFDDHEELKYRLRKGFICLTDHGNYVAYRNIRIKEL
ncbi:MAG: DUF1080 domain-containing protein [Candidatus Hydrogenedentota bacterium]